MAKKSGWSIEQLAAAKHYATTPDARIYKTDAELAAALRISDRQLRNWKAQPEFQAIITKHALQFFKNQTPKIIHAMLMNMTSTGTAAARSQETWARYVLPMLNKFEDEGFFDEIEEPVRTAFNSETSLLERLQAQSPETQALMLELLGDWSKASEEVQEVPDAIEVERDNWGVEFTPAPAGAADTGRAMVVVQADSNKPRPMLGMSPMERLRRKR